MQFSKWLVLGVIAWGLAWTARGQEEESTSADIGQVEPEAILSIAVDPSNPRVVYAGTSGLGLVKSLDAGNSWSSIASELSDLGIPVVAVHPASSQVVYVGTRGQGIWLSTSAGIHFEDASRGLPSPFVRDIVIDPTSPRLLYAATAQGVARSESAGRRWRPIGNLRNVVDLELGALIEASDCVTRSPSGFEFGACRVVWAVADGAIWRSATSGRSFRAVLDIRRLEELAGQSQSSRGQDATRQAVPDRGAGAPPAAGSLGLDEKLFVRVAPSSGVAAGSDAAAGQASGLVYIGSSRLGLFRSRDGGLTFAHLPGLGSGVLSLVVDPRDPRRIFAGTEQGVFQSNDAGRSFLRIEQGSELPIEVLAIDPRRPDFVYAGVPGGRLLIRRDGGSWSLRGLRDGQLTLGGEELYSGSRDRLDRLPARPLGEVSLGPQTNVLIHQIEADRRFPHVLYAATSRGIYRSGDAGKTWSARREGLGEMPIQALAVEPADSYARRPSEEATLLVGTRGAGVYRSALSGRSWQAASRGLIDPDVRAVWIDRHDSDIALAGTGSSGIFRSEDGGRSWREASEGLVELGIRDFAAGNQELYAGTVGGGVYRSPDLGRSWLRLGTVGLESPKEAWLDLWYFGIDAWRLDVRALAVHPDRDHELVAATAFGLMRSVDAGLTWTWNGRFMNATDIAYDPRRPSELVAATSRGVVRSEDAGSTWQPVQRLRLDQEREEAAIVSVAILEAGEASGAVLAGTDDGRFLVRSDPREKAESIALPTFTALIDRRLEAQGYSQEMAVPKEDARRLARDRFLVQLATATEDELLMEDVRLMALVALEAWLRGEDFFEEKPEMELERVLRSVIGHWASLQDAFRDERAPTKLEIDPGGRFFAATHHWDDGAQQRSDLRVFRFENALLYGEELERLGPSRFWKELHEPDRRPEQMPPSWIVPDAGRFLAWDLSGSTIATSASPRSLTLWRLGSAPVQASAVPSPLNPRHVGGFLAPPAAAAFAPNGVHLGAIDREGRPYFVKLSQTSDVRPQTLEAPKGGARFLAMFDSGMLTFSDEGFIRFWPLPDPLSSGEPKSRLLSKEKDRFAKVMTSPSGEWALAAVYGGEKARPERWGEILLIPSLNLRPGVATVIGGGAYWSHARFSPDGKWVAIWGRENAEIWKLEKEPQRMVSADSGGPVRFSPDGELVQIGDEIFRLVGPAKTADRVFRGSDSSLVQPLAFFDRSEIWRLFDMDRHARRARIWHRPEMIKYSSDPEQLVRASPDGRWLVATGITWQLHLWHFGDEELGALAPQTGEGLISSRRVHLVGTGPSPADSWIGTEVRDLAGETGSQLFHGVCSVVGRSLTKQEWRRFFGEEPYHRTCARDP